MYLLVLQKDLDGGESMSYTPQYCLRHPVASFPSFTIIVLGHHSTPLGAQVLKCKRERKNFVILLEENL